MSAQLFTWRKVKAYLVHWHMSRPTTDRPVADSVVDKVCREDVREANESNSLAAFT